MTDSRQLWQARLLRATHRLDDIPTGVARNEVQLREWFGATHEFTPAAVLVPVCWRAHGPHIVLTQRTEALRHHGGQISFPGGRIETQDGGPLQAALRESEEEIGLAQTLVEPVGYLDPLITITGFRVLPVLAHVSGAAEFRPDPSEVADVFEVPLEFFLDQNNRVERALMFRGALRTVLAFPYRDKDIWGATAAILDNLVQRLQELE